MTENPPDRRQHGYKELEDKLNAHASQIEDRLQQSVLRAMIAFAVIGLTSAAALVGFTMLLRAQSVASAKIRTQADQIQAQRRETIFRQCDDQNQRHDNTLLKLNTVAVAAEKQHPERAVQIRASVKANRAVIEAIVPKRDCTKVVNDAVKGG